MATTPSARAFPIQERCEKGHVVEVLTHYGLTKREYFAAMAMYGILASRDGNDMLASGVASQAVQQAEALIFALNDTEANR